MCSAFSYAFTFGTGTTEQGNYISVMKHILKAKML